MTSREDLEVFRANLAGLSDMAQRDVRTVLESLAVLPATQAVPLLREVTAEVVLAYGAMAAEVAADYYDMMRADANVSRSFSAEPLDTVPAEQVLASAGFATKGVYTDGLELPAVSGMLMKTVDRLTKKPGRDTLYTAGLRDPSPPRYARIPQGAITCKFCAMLAGRGAVYASAASAGEDKDFHDHCDCAVALIFDGQGLPAGFDPDYYMDLYQELDGAAIDLSRKYDDKGKFVFTETVTTAPRG